MTFNIYFSSYHLPPSKTQAYSLSSAAVFKERKLLCDCCQLFCCTSVIDYKGMLHQSDALSWKGKQGWPEWVHQVLHRSAECPFLGAQACSEERLWAWKGLLSQELCFDLSWDLILICTTLRYCIQAQISLPLSQWAKLLWIWQASVTVFIMYCVYHCWWVFPAIGRTRSLYVTAVPEWTQHVGVAVGHSEEGFGAPGQSQDPTCGGYGQRWPKYGSCVAVQCYKIQAISWRDLGHTKGIATVGCYLKKSFISADL